MNGFGDYTTVTGVLASTLYNQLQAGGQSAVANVQSQLQAMTATDRQGCCTAMQQMAQQGGSQYGNQGQYGQQQQYGNQYGSQSTTANDGTLMTTLVTNVCTAASSATTTQTSTLLIGAAVGAGILFLILKA